MAACVAGCDVLQLSMVDIGHIVWTNTLMFSCLFVVWWRLALRFHPRFRVVATVVQDPATMEVGHPHHAPDATKATDVWSLPAFDRATRADFASRCNSTLHCIIVVIGLAIALTQATFDYSMSPIAGDLRPTQGLAAFSFAYFACDLLVVVGFCVPLWPVFAIHHVAAMVAIGSNLFQENCRRGSTLAIGLFLMVEIATIPLNVYTYAEQFGFPEYGWFQTLAYNSTVFSWVLSRLALPLGVCIVLFTRVVMPLEQSQRYCYIPGLASAVYLTFFCYGVFFGVFLPRFIARCRHRAHRVALGEPPAQLSANLSTSTDSEEGAEEEGDSEAILPAAVN